MGTIKALSVLSGLRGYLLAAEDRICIEFPIAYGPGEGLCTSELATMLVDNVVLSRIESVEVVPL